MKQTFRRCDRRDLFAALALAVVGLAGGCTSTPAARAPATEERDLPLQIHWVRNAAEYKAVLEQTYRLAGEVLARRVESLEPGTWAVVVDADETLISNSEQSKQQALAPGGSFEERWDEWVRRRQAPAIPGASAFLERVRGLGGRVAVVTNRRAHHCEVTEENLRALEMPFDVILCRDETADKSGRWTQVETGQAAIGLPPLEIVMWVGDNIHDFPGLDQEIRFAGPDGFSEFGERFFILPNPLYGSWEANPPN